MTALRFSNRSLALVEAWNPQPNQTRRLTPGPQGVRLVVERGLLLVTQEGDRLDHVLAPGDELRLPGRGLGVAWALEPSSVLVFRDRAGEPRRDATPRGAAPRSAA